MHTLPSGSLESGDASSQKEPETSQSPGAGSFPCCQAPIREAPIPSHRGLAPFFTSLEADHVSPNTTPLRWR